MESLGLLGILALLFLKEAGIPVPVPGDIVVLATGVAAARGDLPAGPALVGIVAAVVAGGVIQFVLIRTVARRPMLALLARVGVGTDRIDRLAARLAAGGAPAVAFARMTPGVRIPSIAAAALAGVTFRPFAIGLAAGNAVFVAAHFVLGYAAGEPALRIAGAAGAPVLAGVALAAVGGVGWLALSTVRRRRSGLPASATVLAWADTACPACLVLAGADLASAAEAASSA